MATCHMGIYATTPPYKPPSTSMPMENLASRRKNLLTYHLLVWEHSPGVENRSASRQIADTKYSLSRGRRANCWRQRSCDSGCSTTILNLVPRALRGDEVGHFFRQNRLCGEGQLLIIIIINFIRALDWQLQIEFEELKNSSLQVLYFNKINK